MMDTEDTYEVKLPEFEGPLDLLLHVVKRHELSILDIPIAFVTEKYLAYLDMMRSLNIDVAGEYLLMAATLAHLKSKELLPRPEQPEDEASDEEGEDSKEALIRRLLEYQRYKEAAGALGDRPALGREVFARGAPPEPIDRSSLPLAEISTFELLSAFADVLKRQRVELSYQITVDRISISDRINQLVDVLQQRESVRLSEILESDQPSAQLRHQLVVTFLALLEMARLKIVRVLQQSPGGEIYLTRRESLSVAPAITEPEAGTEAQPASEPSSTQDPEQPV